MRTFIYMLIAVFWVVSALAQEIDSTNSSDMSILAVPVETLNLSDLQTPTSPGFVLADQAPSSVNRPINPKGFVASLLSLNGGGALEVTPYWILRSKSRDKLSYIDYIHKRLPLRQTFSISATSFRSDSGSYLSTGIRTTLVRFYHKKVTAKADEIEMLLSVQPSDLDTAAISKARQDLKKLDNRPLFAIELAGAILGYSPNNGYERLKRSKLGIWMNMAYRPYDHISLIGLLRYINSIQQPDMSEKSKYFDVGASLGIENNQGTLTINAEYVHRKNYLSKIQSHRFALVGNYKLTEQFYLVGGLGKNFDQVNNIIAVFGVNFGLANSKAKL